MYKVLTGSMEQAASNRLERYIKFERTELRDPGSTISVE